MAFVKVVKNKSYFMRYQTKFKRRREGKTDYYARKRLVIQDKDKYNTPKYRLVARITGTRIIAQVVSATIQGDRVFCAADSQELRRFGVTAGLANYASAYATGLLLARRLLSKVQLADAYKGVEKVDGADYDVNNHVGDRRPFKAVLDVGLKATTLGSRVFAVLKGACDGGLYVPHGVNKFPGYTKDGDEAKLSKAHRERIVGAHIDNYIAKLKNNNQKSQLQFSKWTEALKAANVASVEKLYLKVHDEIRKNPVSAKRAPKANYKRDHTKLLNRKINNEQRKKNIQAKIEITTAQLKKIQAKKN